MTCGSWGAGRATDPPHALRCGNHQRADEWASSMKRTSNQLRRTFFERLLGLFVVCQLALLLCTVSLGHVPIPAARPVAQVLRRWKELTGQWQGWGFFTGWATRRAAFAIVELQWADRIVQVPSNLEPDDPTDYFHPVLLSHRLLDYESKLVLHQEIVGDSLYWNAPEEAWKKYMSEVFAVHGVSIHSFVRWQWQRYQSEHRDASPPDQAILKVRVYTASPVGGSPSERPPPSERVVARWRPDNVPPEDYWPMDVYIPAVGRFERVLHAPPK